MRSILLLSLFLTGSALVAQTINQQTTDSRDRVILLGPIDQQGLSEAPFSSWFLERKSDYQAQAETLEKLHGQLGEYDLTLFMGTWCGDSKREVPRLYSLLETADYPMERMTAIAVSPDSETYKQSPGAEERGLNIHRVPTLILSKDGKEVGRIVEHPQLSLEEDLLAILEGNYQSHYAAVDLLDALIDDLGVQKFRTQMEDVVPEYRQTLESVYELTTYSAVLEAAGMQEKALAVAQFNTLIYPEEAYAMLNLGKRQKQAGMLAEARKTLENLLVQQPENKQAKKLLASLGEEQR
ncbi:TlpA family protein disulfide reductase [Aureitalea marina]|uniref:Thioredoxin domain-containing protein n=1 Tax=Aureitalea marina TaxID=930804 RepID=A0A2S7KQZ2_9FLAO|nr:thioredoxin family protein [Aureitalea marina]PQB05008.1 hypothetical protein BST85_08970 [Aureitalea marina]